MKKTRTIRILVLGDQTVGKTTFISTLISQPEEQVQRVMRPVVLPPNMCVIAPNVFTELVDTSDQTDFETQLQYANVVLVMYDMGQDSTIDSLFNKWLPLVDQCNNQIPVILVGNKKDKIQLKDAIGIKTIKDVVNLTLKKYRQVEMGLQCSAYYNNNVSQILNAAHQSVIYPFKPLYDMHNKTITLKLKKALTRIFRILDKDYDGILSDKEMSNLQQSVFGSQLDNYDLNRIRQLIKIQLENYDIIQISLSGFIALQKRCIQSLNIQICWSILRGFGYNDKLQLSPQSNSLIFNDSEGISIQLKSEPVTFLTKLFNYYQNIQNEPSKVIKSIFFPLENLPFPELQNRESEMSVSDFILMWHYYAYIDYLKCYQVLRNIGYGLDLQDTFLITNKKVSWKDTKKTIHRNVISVGIFQNSRYSNYIQNLFPLKIQYHNIPSSYTLYSAQECSKIVVLFKLNEKNYTYFTSNPNNKKILDIVMYFEEDRESLYPIIQKFDISTLKKMITKENTVTDLQIQKLSELDLEKLPISYKKSNTTKFFSLIWNTLLNIEKQFDKPSIQGLKANQQFSFRFIIPIAVLSAAAVGAYYILKKAFQKK